jgi:hypothetical protein
MVYPAPIALFVFNRADHTQATLRALGRNELAGDSHLFVFCDGARNADDEPKVEEVRRVVKEASGFAQLTVVERPHNFGLAGSVIAGVTQVLESGEAVIVVEDDLTTSPAFLRFMNDGLRRYADDARVWSLCGYAYPTWRELEGAFFVPGAHPWGWATWRRAWSLFEPDAEKLLRALSRHDLLYDFDVEGSFPHSDWLLRSSRGEGDSWALRWMGSAILHEGLTLHPAKTLVHNTGMDESGTNAPDTDFYEAPLAETAPGLPEGVPATSARALQLLRAYLIGWRRSWSRREDIYYRVTPFMPRSVERRIYSAMVRRSLRLQGVI